VKLFKTQEEREAEAVAAAERRARDLNPLRRFEYHVLRVGLKARAEPQLNELGEVGWQLVQVVEMEGHLAFYLERELPLLEEIGEEEGEEEPEPEAQEEEPEAQEEEVEPEPRE
jgi:hypothetical protein